MTWDTDGLGLGALDAPGVQQILGLARCLIRSEPEEAQLDLPAQRFLASMQVQSPCHYMLCLSSGRKL